MQNFTFKRHRFPPEIIRHAVWSSNDDVKEMMEARFQEMKTIDSTEITPPGDEKAT